jgi:hypothetical protein
VTRQARSGKLPVAHRVSGYRGALLFDEALIEQMAEQKDATRRTA